MSANSLQNHPGVQTEQITDNGLIFNAASTLLPSTNPDQAHGSISPSALLRRKFPTKLLVPTEKMAVTTAPIPVSSTFPARFANFVLQLIPRKVDAIVVESTASKVSNKQIPLSTGENLQAPTGGLLRNIATNMVLRFPSRRQKKDDSLQGQLKTSGAAQFEKQLNTDRATAK